MAKSILGENIAKYRKEARLTQEELGKMVGVSTQAVSRWECGGTPDVELLPVIADSLHVSIDALYGRDGGEALDLKKLLFQNITSAPKEQCLDRVLDYVWTMQQAAFFNGMPEFKAVMDFLPIQVKDRSEEEHPMETPSQLMMGDDRCYMLYGTALDRRFAAIIPEPENGFASVLKKPEEYRKLFLLLAKPHCLELLIDICKRKPKEHFTERSAATRMGISEEEAKELLEELHHHVILERMEVVDEKGTMGVYHISQDVSLVSFLFFCESIMRSCGSMCMNMDMRQKPVFADTPGTGSLVPKWTLRGDDEEE